MLNGSELIILQNGLFSLPTTLATIQQCTVWFGSAWSQSDGRVPCWHFTCEFKITAHI